MHRVEYYYKNNFKGRVHIEAKTWGMDRSWIGKKEFKVWAKAFRIEQVSWE